MWDAIFSIVFGFFFVALMLGIFHSLVKIRRSRTKKQKAEVVGYKGKVLLPIPASGQGKGRVWISINGVVSEYDAITLGADELATGTSVIVLNVVDDKTLEVKRIRLASDMNL